MRILVADDQIDILEALRLLLKGAGHQVTMAQSPAALLKAAADAHHDLILADLNYARDTTSGQEGLDLLSSLQLQQNPAPVIVMTAWGSIDLAVEAMRRGACDFVQKPWDNARLLEAIDKQARLATERVEAARRAKSDMEIARSVQQKLFPQKNIPLRTIEYAGVCVPAREVGGDYYDYVPLGRSSLGFVLADVSGKGVAAALLMANLQAAVRAQCHSAADPSDPVGVLKAVNGQLFESTAPEHYATLFFGTYDDATTTLRYVNCGHLPPLLIRANGEVERLEPTATVLGVFERWDCDEQRVQLCAGDILVLFSDGISEAGIEIGDCFGEDRIATVVQAAPHAPLMSIVNDITAAVQAFCPDFQSDDQTVVAIRGISS